MSFIWKTTQVSALKVIFETLKEVVTYAGIDFDENGGVIQCKDNSEKVIFYLHLDAAELNSTGLYQCKKQVRVNISVPDFHRVLKTAKDTDTVTIKFDENDVEFPLTVTCKNKDNTKDKDGIFKISYLGNVDECSHDISQMDLGYGSMMESTVFMQIFKDLSCLLGKVVCIQDLGESIRFSSQGDAGEAAFHVPKKQVEGEVDANPFSEYFSLKFLQIFSKPAKLTASVSMYLTPNLNGSGRPLMLAYELPYIGQLKFLLIPKADGEDVPLPSKKIYQPKDIMALDESVERQQYEIDGERIERMELINQIQKLQREIESLDGKKKRRRLR